MFLNDIRCETISNSTAKHKLEIELVNKLLSQIKHLQEKQDD